MQQKDYLALAAVEDRMWYFRALHRHAGRELGRHLRNGRGSYAVLDAGCGTGGLILALRPRLPRVTWTGLDFSALACELARQRTGAEIIEGSVEAPPFADQSFDAVISADVICQIEDAAVALREFHRILRPGGLVIINVPALKWLWSYHDDRHHTKHRFARQELLELLRAANLAPLFCTYRNCLVFPVIAAKRKLTSRSADSSDVRLFPAPIETAFNGLMALEHAWMSRRWRFPIGTSVFAVAQKPK